VGFCLVVVTVASLHDKMGHHSKAVPLYEEALTIYRDIHGYVHQSVADTMCLLADSMSHIRSSESDASSGMKMDRSIPDHKAAENLNQDQQQNPHYLECVNIFKEAIKIYHKLELGDDKVSVKALKQLATLHERYEHLEEAKQCYEMVMRTYVNTHIGVCEELGDTYMEFGKLLCLKEESLEAITIFGQALTVYSQLFGDLHVKVADALYAEGEALIDIKSLEEAQTYFEKALVIYTEVVPMGHQIGDCHNSVGYICQELDEYEEAKEYYRKALTCYLKCHGKYHSSVANVINNMATVFDDLEEHEAAAHFYEQSIAIMRRIHGPYHPQIVQSLENLSSLMEGLGIYDKAQELQEEADRVSAALDKGLPSIPEHEEFGAEPGSYPEELAPEDGEEEEETKVNLNDAASRTESGPYTLRSPDSVSSLSRPASLTTPTSIHSTPHGSVTPTNEPTSDGTVEFADVLADEGTLARRGTDADGSEQGRTCVLM
jgi:tetratricopeptide (TPR) repeat protein